METTDGIYYATGKRKTSVACVWLKPGTGQTRVNGRTLEEYFGGVEAYRIAIHQPFERANVLGSYDVRARVRGGGKAGQAGAIRHGIAKALEEARPEVRTALKRAGFMTRDPRVKERKKYGQKGARARFQFSKR